MTTFDRKDDYGYIMWSSEVKKRDHYTCTICGRKGVALNAHHLNAWAGFPDQRYNIDNGTTLCIFHHDDFHSKFGKGNNNKQQFEEYKKIAEELIKIANEEAIQNITVKKMIQKAERDAAVEKIIKDLEKTANK